MGKNAYILSPDDGQTTVTHNTHINLQHVRCPKAGDLVSAPLVTSAQGLLPERNP